MKIIDKTPLFKDGKLSLVDRAKAILQFGSGWIKDIEAQNSVLDVLNRTLDKKFTALRNIILPGLETAIPIILIGQPGIYVICVTPLTGMFRAKGDQWGSISGNYFKPEKPNLLTRTERFAHAVQAYMQRQGYADLPDIEAVLLCSDPTIHIDSLRPIVRVVMRDALERFAVSINQGSAVLSPESVFDIVNRITTPPAPAAANADEQDAALKEKREDEDFNARMATLGSQASSAPFTTGEPVPPPRFQQPGPRASTFRPGMRHQRRGLNGKQWALLIAMFAAWCLIMVVFIALVLYPSLLP